VIAGKVVVSRRLTDRAQQELSDRVDPVFVLGDVPPERERLLAAVAGAVGAVTMLTEQVDEEFFAAAGPGLKIVANVAVGFDNVDTEAAARHGVIVTNTPGVLDESTADLTMALMLATTRRVVEADAFVRRGEEWIWGPRDWIGLDVSAGATLGIIGLGRIGSAVARRARAFGMTVIASGRGAATAEAEAMGVQYASIDEIFRRADVVSLHCPLMPATRGMVDDARIRSMRPGSYLINTARGPLVDEEALADALESGHLAGVGLDVHQHEPRLNDRLRADRRTVLLPHIGSAGAWTRDEMCLLAVRNVISALSGGAALTPVGTAPVG